MRTLQINEETFKDVAGVIAYAKANVFTVKRIYELMEGKISPPGDDPGHVVHIHDGYRVVYSIDEHHQKVWSHISVSIEAQDKLPNQAAVERILELFAMKPVMDSEAVWVEESAGAVNILQEA